MVSRLHSPTSTEAFGARVTRAGALGRALTLAVGLASVALATAASGQDGAPAGASAPVEDGQTIVMATHSFNVFIGRPLRSAGPGLLEPLAAERGKAGHEMLAVQFIGGSTPMQHWQQGGDDDSRNVAKAALLEAGADLDVFTMSPTRIVPEDGIDLFGDFIIAHNPNARIMVQSSWLAFDGKAALPSAGGTGAGDFTAEMRDDVTIEEIDGWLAALREPGGYLERLRSQLSGIDERAGREITSVVPSDVAVYTLRRHVIAGDVPGVDAQTQLFADTIGHATAPTEHVVAYAWYAAMYRESPVGLASFVDENDPTSAAREELLQRIAWNAVVSEPKSGVTGEPLAID